jgi:hypothetical protein
MGCLGTLMVCGKGALVGCVGTTDRDQLTLLNGGGSGTAKSVPLLLPPAARPNMQAPGSPSAKPECSRAIQKVPNPNWLTAICCRSPCAEVTPSCLRIQLRGAGWALSNSGGTGRLLPPLQANTRRSTLNPSGFRTPLCHSYGIRPRPTPTALPPSHTHHQALHRERITGRVSRCLAASAAKDCSLVAT